MVLNPSKPLYIIGRFPPPYDGQTILTLDRMVDGLEAAVHFLEKT